MLRSLPPGCSQKKIVEVSMYKCVAFGVKITSDVCEYYTCFTHWCDSATHNILFDEPHDWG